MWADQKAESSKLILASLKPGHRYRLGFTRLIKLSCALSLVNSSELPSFDLLTY